MEHFSVVESIIRAALAGDRDALDKQILRLRERLEKAGQSSAGRLMTAQGCSVL
jgi:hypothetical protein